ncbi:PaaI family thioesterase [Pseudonocardia sp. KRD291]|uniref:PaaI family thioesterase n=1 Tax=Pseudonocardia sp. KRD291 TaxID=2792007 RepID=UPI001C49EC8F|nr:hotdog domain-containing protein [Pseudonocardia sp. KRD291]MBW0103581.1 PaaI family thioesterase [Pseudonocardia sp. KRD291]
MTALLTGDDLAARAALALQVPLQRELGIELIDAAAPETGAAFVVGELAGNGAGGTHAGALAVGLELAALLATLPHLAPTEHAVTASTSTNLAAAARTGQRVEFRGSVDRRTGRLAFTTVVATCEGTVLARANVVKSVVTLR